MDLTPRTATEPGAQPPARKRRWLPILVVVGALLGGGIANQYGNQEYYLEYKAN